MTGVFNLKSQEAKCEAVVNVIYIFMVSYFLFLLLEQTVRN